MSYDPSNIFARILRGEIPCNKVYEDEFALAFYDIAPVAPVHILVVPKGEFISFQDFSLHASAPLIQGYFKAIQTISSLLAIDKTGYRLITNHGNDAHQTVPHFHTHILAGEDLGALL